MKKISIIAVVLALILVFVGCKDADKTDRNSGQTPVDSTEIPEETEPREIVYERVGVSIRLPETFKDCSELPLGKKYDFLYASEMIGIYGTHIRKDDTAEGIVDLAGFCQQTAASVQGETKEHNGILTVSYVQDSQGEKDQYVCAFFETEIEYVIITAYCPERMYEFYQNDMLSYITEAKVQ